jgi:hypothetical protein
LVLVHPAISRFNYPRYQFATRAQKGPINSQ